MEPTEQNFEEILPAVDALLEEKVSVNQACEEGIVPQPHSDVCERALGHYTALLFNVESDRLPGSCTVDLSSEGCTSGTVAMLVDELATLINKGDRTSCQTATSCAETMNGGSAVIDGATTTLTPVRSSPQPISGGGQLIP